MATVSEVVVKYAARGAKEAQRADKGVRGSIKETARTARKESGQISQWMQRHKTALLAIGAATAAAMGMIIKNSPELSAQLSSVRLGFSLLAMTIGSDLAPATEGVGSTIIGMADAFAELPPVIRKPISFLIALVGIIGVVLPVIAGLQSLISGTVVASFLAWIASLVPSISLMGALSAIAGVVMSALTALAAALGITVGAAAALVVAIAAIIAIIVAYIFNIGGARDAINGWLDTIWNFISSSVSGFLGWAGDVWGAAKKATGKFLSEMGNLKERGIKRGKELADGFVGRVTDLKDRSVSRIKELAGDAKERFLSLVDSSKRWGKDLMTNFADGIMSKARAVERRVGNVIGDIKSKISFDRIENDRMAQRWGSDLMEHFSKGMRSSQSMLRNALPGNPGEFGAAPAPIGGASGGGGETIIEITIEEGAIQIRGSGSSAIDTDRLAEQVSNEIDTQFGKR